MYNPKGRNEKKENESGTRRVQGSGSGWDNHEDANDSNNGSNNNFRGSYEQRRNNTGYPSYGNNRNDRRGSYGGNSSYGNKGGFRKNDSYGRGGYGRGSAYNEPREVVELPEVEFNKVFFQNTLNMSAAEVEKFRSVNDMKIIGDKIPSPITNFSETPFDRSVLEHFAQKKYTQPTPIQAQGWSMALSGRDMVGIAETGSGKTISFVLPALIHAKDQIPLRKGDGPIVLVLAPTRELVLQIKEVFDEYTRYFGLNSTAVYGGVSSFNQKKDLERGCEILIATPGRLIDLHESGYCPLKRVTFLVLDEADRMLDMGFEPQLVKIIPKTNAKRQTLMWSATWPREVRILAERFMSDYIQVTIGSEELKTNNKIKQIIEVVKDSEKNGMLLESLEDLKNEKIIVFANKKRTCDLLEDFLCKKGFYAKALHGDKTQNVRDKIIQDFKAGRKNILIATDVAARGLDIKDIKMVINYDFPLDIENYVHRIGRTARGSSLEGLSRSFFTDENRSSAKELIRMLRDSNQEVNPLLIEMGAVRSSSNSRYSRGNWSRYGGNRY